MQNNTCKVCGIAYTDSNREAIRHVYLQRHNLPDSYSAVCLRTVLHIYVDCYPMKCVVTSDLNRKDREDYMRDRLDNAVETLAAEIKADLLKGVYVDGAIDWRAADICDEISLDLDQEELREALGEFWRSYSSSGAGIYSFSIDASIKIAKHLDAAADKLCEQLARKKLAEADQP